MYPEQMRLLHPVTFYWATRSTYPAAFQNHAPIESTFFPFPESLSTPLLLLPMGEVLLKGEVVALRNTAAVKVHGSVSQTLGAYTVFRHSISESWRGTLCGQGWDLLLQRCKIWGGCLGTGLQGRFLFKKIFLHSEGCRWTWQGPFTPSNFLHLRLDERKRASSLD